MLEVMSEPPLHPALEPIAWLLGTWAGEGKGHYPTIDSFGYREDSRFAHAGKPVMSYLQRTWALEDGAALHSESGFLRPKKNGAIELVLAHGFGIAEVSEGTMEGRRIELMSRSLVPTTTAKHVLEVRRVIEGDRDTMTYEIDMSIGDHPLQNHLHAQLYKR
jgi:THAP4-like, heme-binding beta-barrel domain